MKGYVVANTDEWRTVVGSYTALLSDICGPDSVIHTKALEYHTHQITNEKIWVKNADEDPLTAPKAQFHFDGQAHKFFRSCTPLL